MSRSSLSKEAILALDQGSSHSRAILFDNRGKVLTRAGAPLQTDTPRPGWVEHPPEKILQSAMTAMRKALRQGRQAGKRIVALGIANQRSTFLCWDRKSGKPFAPAISWQDLRTAGSIHQRESPDIAEKTGLPLAPYYSATKLAWLLDHFKKSGQSTQNLLCGTVNTFLIWHLTGGKEHRTDPTNAARMLLYNLKQGDWDEDLLKRFQIPRKILPEIYPTQSYFGEASIDQHRLPITCSIGDQQASLAGLGGLQAGMANLNYGTGGFFLINTGAKLHRIPGLLSSIAWSSEKKTTYLIEGTVNSVGSLFKWLRQLGLLQSDREINRLCARSTQRIFFLPALAGLGAPHWDSQTTTSIFGLTSSTRQKDWVRGAVEGIAFLMNDIHQLIKKDGSIPIRRIIASGGGSQIKSLLQFQADLFGRSIGVIGDLESTARGASLLAGETAGVVDRERFQCSPIKEIFSPQIGRTEREALHRRWRKTLALAQAWGSEQGKSIVH